MRRIIVLAFVVLCVSAVPASATAPKNGMGFAIADDDGTGTLDDRFQRLAPKTFRFMVAWNAIYTRGARDDGVARAHQMIGAARRRGVEQIVVSFNKDYNAPSAPTARAYRDAITAFVNELRDEVDVWGPANEPNCGGGWQALNGATGGQLTAQYYQALRSVRDAYDRDAWIISPDLCDSSVGSSMATWINAYKAAGGGFGVAIAMHPYWDIRIMQTTQLNDMLGLIGGSLPVWVTEGGGFGRHRSAGIVEFDAAGQAASTEWMVRTLANHPRIERLYYYHLRGGNRDWDTALTDGNGQPRSAWYSWCGASHGGNGLHPDCVDGASEGWRSSDGVAVRSPGAVALFARNSGSSLQLKRWSATGGWDTTWTTLGGLTVMSDPEAISLHQNHIAAFVRGVGNQMWSRWWDASVGWSAWEAMGGSIAGQPAVVSRFPGKMDVFARGTDNALKHKWWDVTTGWSEWESLGGVIYSDPTAVTLHGNHVAAFARGSDNRMYSRWWDASTGWSGWESLGGSIIGRPAIAVRPGRMDVFARGTDSSLQHAWWDAGVGWGGWESLGGMITTDPAAVSLHANHVAAYARGSGDRMYERWWDASVGWSGWIDHGGTLGNAPMAVTLHPGNVAVYARGMDGLMRQSWWLDPATGGWSGWSYL